MKNYNYKKYIIASLLSILAFCIGWQLSERTKIDINCPRCDYEIAKASRPRIYGGTKPLGKAPSGIKSNGYTNLELKNLLTKMV